MSYKLRPAITSEAKPLIGFYSESSGGKTHSALLLACGFCDGDMSKVAMIETEAGRGEAYADDPVVGGYHIVSLRSNFSPAEYGKAIAAVEQADMRAMIIDSASHEWEGVGGVLAMAAANAETKKGPLVWQKPKIEHQREFMLRLMQSPVPLVIVCMRAKYPMYEVTAADVQKWEAAGRPGKPPKVGEWARSWKLEPKQSDDILYEMFVHGWFDAEQHRFHGTKYTRESMKEVFRDNDVITLETGKRLAAWASGRKVTAPARAPAQASSSPEPGAAAGGVHAEITTALGFASDTVRKKFAAMVATYNVKAHTDLSEEDAIKALGWLKGQIDKQQTTLV